MGKITDPTILPLDEVMATLGREAARAFRTFTCVSLAVSTSMEHLDILERSSRFRLVQNAQRHREHERSLSISLELVRTSGDRTNVPLRKFWMSKHNLGQQPALTHCARVYTPDFTPFDWTPHPRNPRVSSRVFWGRKPLSRLTPSGPIGLKARSRPSMAPLRDRSPASLCCSCFCCGDGFCVDSDGDVFVGDGDGADGGVCWFWY